MVWRAKGQSVPTIAPGGVSVVRRRLSPWLMVLRMKRRGMLRNMWDASVILVIVDLTVHRKSALLESMCLEATETLKDVTVQDVDFAVIVRVSVSALRDTMEIDASIRLFLHELILNGDNFHNFHSVHA